MATTPFDRSRVQALLALAGDRLDGEWLLIGGAAAAAWFAAARTTEDIDLMGMRGTQDERFALMELAAAVSIPIEAVNSAADFFVRRISDWRQQLVVLHRGERATIYRPNATLFLLLKIERLTEVDLGDCVQLLDHCRTSGEAIDATRVAARLDALPSTDDEELRARRTRLAAMLRSSAP